MKNSKEKEQEKSEEQSDSKEEISESNLSSQDNEQKSEQQINIESQKIKIKSVSKKQVNPNPIQTSNVSYVSYHQLSEQIPQQQVQTDDIDSNDPNNIVVQEIRGQPESEQHNEDVQDNEKDVQKMDEQGEQHQEKLNQELPIEDNLQQNQNNMNQKLKQIPASDNMYDESKQKKKKKQKKNKSKKTKLHNLQQHDNIEKTLQKMDIQNEEIHPEVPIISQEDTSNNVQDANPQEDEQQDSINPFYEYIHPYLMLVGSSVIQSYMSKKPSYRANQASQWASELSSKVLLKAYFDSLDEPQNFEEEKNKSVKSSIIQTKIQQNKFYRKLQVELNQLAQSQSFSQISLSKIYFLIKKFKIIASCIILEKKSRAQVSVNISSSSFWNKQKDGQINFSYEGKNCFVMLTLYGVENTRQQQNQNESRRQTANQQKRR